MDNTKSKAAYAAFLLKESDPFKAACMLCPDDTGRALWFATNWANDPEVIGLISELKRSSGFDALPGKYDSAKLLWDMANDSKVEAKDRIAALKEYNIVTKITDPKGNTTNINIENSPRVMVMKDHGTDDEWEKKAAAQQSQLTGGKYVANTRH